MELMTTHDGAFCFIPPDVFVPCHGRQGRGSEPLFGKLRLHPELTPPNQKIVGLSLDFTKTVYRVPLERMPSCVLQPYMYMFLAADSASASVLLSGRLRCTTCPS